MDFCDRVAMVTGGGTGIGRATAILLAKAGASVVIGNRRTALGQHVVQEIRSSGGRAVFQAADITKQQDVQSLVTLAVREFGALHLAFNNAGVLGQSAPLHQQQAASAEQVMSTNVIGTLNSMKFEIEQMIADGGGAIVNNSSLLGLKGTRGMAPYVASKHAIAGLTKTAALDYADTNIRVNAVAPGPIDTQMLEDASGGDPQLFAKQVPMRRIGTPDEVAHAVLWLLSDEASYVTGHVLPIAGGWAAK